MTEPFDPYRYGRPEQPVPPEYAPPGYVFDPTTSSPPSSGGSAPLPPPYHGYRQPRPGNGRAIAALVLGIVAVLLCWLSILDAVPVVLAFVFGSLGLGEAKRGGGGRGMAISGIVLAMVGAVLAVVVTTAIFRAADKCGGLTQSNTSSNEFRRCLTDQF